MTVGTAPVRVATDDAGNPRHGFHPSGYNGWLALKTHFVSTPPYQGPFLVRARRLDRGGVIRLGGTPSQTAPLFVSGPRKKPQRRGSWRDTPYFTFVRSPGCYGWQIDGLNFSTTIVVRILSKYHA
jgi:hypothetical protein